VIYKHRFAHRSWWIYFWFRYANIYCVFSRRWVCGHTTLTAVSVFLKTSTQPIFVCVHPVSVLLKIWWWRIPSFPVPLQHSATHCNTLQHTATQCNTLHHSATHCNTLHHTAPHCNDDASTTFQSLSSHTTLTVSQYGVATTSRLLKIIGLFCKKAL